MGKVTINDFELGSLFDKKNYSRKNGKILVFRNNDINSYGYHKWLRVDYAVLKIGHQICKSGKTGVYNGISVLRSKIENRIPFFKNNEA